MHRALVIPPPSLTSSSVSPLDFHIRHILSLISLCLLALEYVGTCRFEFTHIWSRPVSLSKVLFIFSRYYEITNQVTHYFLIHLILGRSPIGISPHRCAIWYSLMFSGLMLNGLILDTILFLRVYVLHGKSRLIFLVVIPFATTHVISVYVSWNTLVYPQQAFDGVCSVVLSDPTLAFVVGISVIISHLIVWVLGYVKRNMGHGHVVPIVKLVVHEAAWVFIVHFAIVAVLMPSSIAVKTTNPFLNFASPATLVSILNCRIIQNMHNIAITEQNQSAMHNDGDFQLTTFIHDDLEIRNE